MADVIIIVDDEKQTTAKLAYRIGEEISKQSKGNVRIEMLDNVKISEAREDILEAISNIVENGKDSLLGILIDLFEGTDHHSGVKLLEKLKSDPAPCTYPMIVFTSKLINISYQEVISKGAVDVIQRDLVGGQAPHKKIATKVLETFNRIA